jgi:hypothetical protein
MVMTGKCISQRRKNMRANMDLVKQLLDNTFIEVGTDCPIFPVMVVLVLAAMAGNACPDYLHEFTGYRREFLNGIATNMTNNGLWKDDRYIACTWLHQGRIDGEEFIQHLEAAMGNLWYSKQAAERPTVDVLWIKPNGDHSSPLTDGSRLRFDVEGPESILVPFGRFVRMVFARAPETSRNCGQSG